MNYKYIIFSPYFGQLPNYFNLWAHSCSYNKEFLFIVFTDCDYKGNLPENVKIISMSFRELQKQVQALFDFPISLDTPYKLCDYKPVFGYIFQKYLNPSALYWGHCDMDLLFGDLVKFLPTKMFDKIGNLGHFCLYRNTPQIREAFKLSSGHSVTFEYILSSPVHFAFDELPGYGIDTIFQKNDLSIYPFEKHVAETILRKGFCLSHCDYPNRTRDNTPRIFAFEEGKVYSYEINNNVVSKIEYAYVHFPKQKIKINLPEAYNQFLIIPGAFERWQKPTVQMIYRAHNTFSKLQTYWRYISVRRKTAPRRLRRMWNVWKISRMSNRNKGIN